MSATAATNNSVFKLNIKFLTLLKFVYFKSYAAESAIFTRLVAQGQDKQYCSLLR